MLTEGMVYWWWLHSMIPALLVLLSISSRKAKPVRKLVSQHAAAVCLSCEALIFFLVLWYRVTGIPTKIFTESKGVMAAGAVSLNKKKSILFVQYLLGCLNFLREFRGKNTNPTFLFNLFEIKKKKKRKEWPVQCFPQNLWKVAEYFTVIRCLICVYN